VETQAAPAEACDLSPRMGSILRQSVVLFMGNVLLLLGGYGFKIFLARRIGAEGLGIFALGECLVSFALLLVVWEMQQAFFRFIPEFMSRGEFERIRRLIWSSLSQVLILSLAAAGVLYGTREFWGENVFQAGGLAGALAVFAFMLPPRALEVAARQLARSYKEVRRVVIIQTFVAFPVKVSVSMRLIGVGWGLSGWLWGEAVAYLVSAAGLGWLAFKLTPPSARTPLFGVIQERGVYGFAATATAMAGIGLGSVNLSTLLMGVFLGPKAVGIYSVAFLIATLLTLLQGALNGVFVPHIAELNALGKKSELARLYYRVTRWDLMATLPLFIICGVLPGPMLAVFGEDFREGALALGILTLGQWVNVGTGPVGNLLVMTGHQNRVLGSQIGQLTLTTVLLILLVPYAGLTGAALASSLGTVSFFLSLYLGARKLFPIYIYDRNNLKMLASGVCLIGVAWIFGNHLRWVESPLLLLIVTATILYVFWGLWVFWALADVEDRRFVGEAIGEFCGGRAWSRG